MYMHTMTNEIEITFQVPVFPPAGAVSARDLWDIKLPTEVEQLNYKTHWFGGSEMRCGDCDCRMGGEWARFACTATQAGAVSYETYVLANGGKEV